MVILESLSAQQKQLFKYLQTHLLDKNKERIKTKNNFLSYVGGLETKPNVWPEIASSLQSILDGKQIDNPGWKKIQNNNYEYHVRGQYKVVYSWLTENNQKILILKAIGHSATIMPIMNKL